MSRVDGDWAETLRARRYESLPTAETNQAVVSRVVPLNLSAVPASGSIAEIRISSGGNTGWVELLPGCAVSESDLAVSFQNGDYSPWSTNQTGPLYAFVPFHAEALVLKNKSSSASLRVSGADSDLTGPVGSPVTIESGPARALIPKRVSWQGVGHSDVLWKLEPSNGDWKFAAGGFPLILSSSQATVRTLAAGLSFDGKHMLAHPFQHEYLSTLRGLLVAQVGDSTSLRTSVVSTLSGSNSTAMSAFPNYFLALPAFGPLVDAYAALGSQNTNRLSDWVGSSDGWQMRDPESPLHLSDEQAAPATIYAAQLNDDFQLSTTQVAGHQNLPISNQVTYVAAGETRQMPLSDVRRWDRMTVVAPVTAGGIVSPAMQMGASSDDGSALASLSLLAQIDGSKSSVPFENPLYANKALLFRTALSALDDLAALPEQEVWQFPSSALDGMYAGGTLAFLSARKVFPTYGNTGELLRKLFCSSSPTVAEKTLYHCSQLAPLPPLTMQQWAFTNAQLLALKEAWQIWTDGLHHVAYRIYPNNLVSARNQSAHFLTSFQDLARGSGDPFDWNLAREYANRWVASQNEAGWFMEKGGPDASYIGMSNYYAASYYLQSCLHGQCDSNVKSSIAKTYAFFNHTVAPEPTGGIIGGFNFNHRVGAGFDSEQFGGARGIANDIPEVSAWNDVYLGVGGRVSRPIAAPDQLNSRYLDFKSMRYLAFNNRPEVAPATLPALEPAPFTKNIHDDLIAIKRPGYYTVVYVGHPAPASYYVNTINGSTMRLPWNYNGESNGFRIGDPHGWSAPYVGGGMSLFWTEDFGNSLLAGNWTPLAHHGLVAVDGQTGVRSWEDYFSTSFSLSPDNSLLRINGSLERNATVMSGTQAGASSSLSGYNYSRAYKFLNESVIVVVRVAATTDAAASAQTRLFENIPLAGGAPKRQNGQLPKLTATRNGQTETIANGAVVDDSELRYGFADSGLRLVTQDGVSKRVITNGPKNQPGLQINRIELNMPLPSVGTVAELRYCLQRLSASPSQCGL
ncbi:MAG: hypothetical protein U0136_05430 [Bdellovibrionota bacterium]